jgi:hypothetical protein
MSKKAPIGFANKMLIVTYRNLFSRRHPSAVAIWKGWRESYDPSYRQFLISLMNQPKGLDDRTVIRSAKYFEESAKGWGLPKDLKALPPCLEDPTVLESQKIPPPSLLVYFDGEAEWNFISEFVGCPIKSKKGFG